MLITNFKTDFKTNPFELKPILEIICSENSSNTKTIRIYIA